jgi:subfamily B ATP-binding cassette protein MsbA
MVAADKSSPRLGWVPPDSVRALIVRFANDWLWPRRAQIVTVLIVTAALAGATVGYPLVIKASFDTLLGNDGGGLVWVLVAIVLITSARSVLLYLQAVLSNKFVIALATDIRKQTFGKLLSLDFGRLTSEAPGQHVSRLTNEITFIETAVQAALNSAVRDVLMIIALVGTLFYLDWVMSLVILLVYPIAFWPILEIGNRLRRVAKRTQAELGGMTALLTEKFSSVRLIKSFRLEDYASKQAADTFDEVYRLRLKAIRGKAKVDPLLEALGGIAVAGVIALAYWRISTGQATVGDFMGFVSALLMAAQPVRGLGNLAARLQEGLAATEKYYALIDETPAITDRPSARELDVSEARIAFENVSFSYPVAGAIPALREVSLDIPGGATVALVGRSGGGKSTMINLVPRLFDVTGGRVTIDGQDIRDVTLGSLRSRIALVSQDITLFDDTIEANIALGRLGADHDEIVAAAQAAAADGFIRAQPDGYHTRIGDAGARLSGGQRQRLALARAILKDAPILLLDEATSALDTESERLVQAALDRFTKNRTTIVIAHRLSTVKDADRIVVLDQGRIAEMGTHDELRARGGIYEELCQSQFVGDSTASTQGTAQTGQQVAQPAK